MTDQEFINLLKKSIWHMKDHTESFPIKSLQITVRPKKRGVPKKIEEAENDA
jgi:hypothetical protein